MKEKLTKNLGIKLLSLPLAVLFWIVIINVDDPTITRTFGNIQVEILNEDEIPSGQVYDIVEDTTISISVTGKRSILDEIDQSDLSATADLLNITTFNKIEIVPACAKGSYSVELTANPKMLTITFEEKISEKFKINVEQRGTVASGCYVGSTEVKPNMIEISGPESTVNKIKDVRVTINVEEASESFTVNNLTPILYDENGKELDSSRLIFGSQKEAKIKVNVTILKTKTVPVDIVVEGEPAEGYYVLEKEYDPQEIEIAGFESVLEETDVLPISVSVDGITADKEVEIGLEEFLPEGVMIVGDMNTIAVRIVIDKEETQTFTLRTSDIELRNLNKDFVYEYIDENAVIEVSVRGKKEILEKLSVNDFNAYIDLHNRKEGAYAFEVKFELAEEKGIVVTKPTISGRLYKEEEPTEPVQEPTISAPTVPTESTTVLEESMQETESVMPIVPEITE